LKPKAKPRPHPLAPVFTGLASTARIHESTFQQARSSEPSFAAFATAAALRTALADKRAMPMRERIAIVEALLLRHQSTRHTLWDALLVCAFRPLLESLWMKDRGCKSDRNQRVLAAFLRALRSVHIKPGHPVFLFVSRATARTLFRVVRAERDELDDAVPIDDDTFSGSSPHRDPHPFTACLANEVAALFAQHKGGEDVVRLVAGLETVGEQVERLSASDGSSAAERVMQLRLYERRYRLVEDVRDTLARKRRAKKGPV
jgi:hypothetical protein